MRDENIFEIDIPALLSVVKATAHDAIFAAWFYKQNEDALHGGNISYQEFKSAFLSDDSDEQNFLLCLGCIPVAWFKVNGLKNDETAWISMIVVSRKHQRQGAENTLSNTAKIIFAEKVLQRLEFIRPMITRRRKIYI